MNLELILPFFAYLRPMFVLLGYDGSLVVSRVDMPPDENGEGRMEQNN